MVERIIDIMPKYEMLTIVSKTGKKAIATCDCGTTKEYYFSNIFTGKTKSCGCLNRRLSSERYKLIGLTHGKANHPLYAIYSCMLSRCYYQSNPMYYRYGGRGILVCDEWKDNFISFFNWSLKNGWANGLQIDRIDNDLGYSPNNCQFLTRKQNCKKREDAKRHN